MIPAGTYPDRTRYAGVADRLHLPPLPDTARAARDARAKAMKHCLRRNKRRGLPRPHEPIRYAA